MTPGITLSLVALAARAALPDAQGGVAPTTAPLRVALVIGNNTPMPGRDQPLRYADDDAYKSAQVLGSAGVGVWLHARFDAETAERTAARGAVGVPRPPTLTALRESLIELRDQVAAARAQGRRTEFYFWYAGHGDIVDGEGAVSLEGGILRRSQLWHEVIATPAADVNHVIIDACRAYFVVFDRGKSVARRPLGQLAVAPIPIELARRTGVVLSTAGGEQSFEWEALRSGIFGHEVRSGLSGGADVDGDGEVSYLELAGFVQSANSALPDPAYRPAVTIRPPTPGGPLLGLERMRGTEIVLKPDLRRHLFLEDALGMRWVDLHPDGDGEVKVWLPEGTRPGYLVSVADHREVALARRGPHQVIGARALRPRRTARRGAAADAFEHLFGRPHGAAAMQRFTSSEAGDAVKIPYAEMVASLERPGGGARPAPPRPARPAPRRAQLAMIQRAPTFTDSLPLATGGDNFIAQPPDGGDRRLVKLYLGSEEISYERFAFLTLDQQSRQHIREESEALYFGDRVRAWTLVGAGGIGAILGGGAATYAFVTGVPLSERLLLGVGGINLALVGAVVTAVGLADHVTIGVAQARRSRVAVDPALLEEGLRAYNAGGSAPEPVR